MTSDIDPLDEADVDYLATSLSYTCAYSKAQCLPIARRCLQAGLTTLTAFRLAQQIGIDYLVAGLDSGAIRVKQ